MASAGRSRYYNARMRILAPDAGSIKPGLLRAKLLQQLKSRDANKRAEAAATTGEILSTASVRVLLPLLADPRYEVRGTAANSLHNFFIDPRIPANARALIGRRLREMLSDKSVFIRQGILDNAISLFGEREAVRIWASHLNDEHAFVRANMVAHLEHFLGPDIVFSLCQRLNIEENNFVKTRIIHVLGDSNDEIAARHIVNFTADRNKDVRGAAATALAKLGAPVSLESAFALLRDRRSKMIARQHGVRALREFVLHSKVLTAQTSRAINAIAKILIEAGEKAPRHTQFSVGKDGKPHWGKKQDTDATNRWLAKVAAKKGRTKFFGLFTQGERMRMYYLAEEAHIALKRIQTERPEALKQISSTLLPRALAELKTVPMPF